LINIAPVSKGMHANGQLSVSSIFDNSERKIAVNYHVNAHRMLPVSFHFFGGGGGRVAVRVSDLGSKGPGFDPRVVPKSECMFVNIYHY